MKMVARTGARAAGAGGWSSHLICKGNPAAEDPKSPRNRNSLAELVCNGYIYDRKCVACGTLSADVFSHSRW